MSDFTDEDLALAQDYLAPMRRTRGDEERLAALLTSVRGQKPAADAKRLTRAPVTEEHTRERKETVEVMGVERPSVAPTVVPGAVASGSGGPAPVASPAGATGSGGGGA